MKRMLMAVGIPALLVSVVSVSALAGSHGDDAGRRGREAGIGGSIDRFQAAGTCDLVPVAGLSGNWTHGSYVSAVAKSGDPSLIAAAAHSDCGKPMVSVGHGNGPPAHPKPQVGRGPDEVHGVDGADEATESEAGDEGQNSTGADPSSIP